WSAPSPSGCPHERQARRPGESQQYIRLERAYPSRDYINPTNNTACASASQEGTPAYYLSTALQLPQEDLSDQLRIRLPFAQLHDLTLQEIDGRLVPGLEVCHGLGVLGNRFFNESFQRARVADLNQPLLFDDDVWRFTAGKHFGKHFLGDFAINLPRF